MKLQKINFVDAIKRNWHVYFFMLIFASVLFIRGKFHGIWNKVQDYIWQNLHSSAFEKYICWIHPLKKLNERKDLFLKKTPWFFNLSTILHFSQKWKWKKILGFTEFGRSIAFFSGKTWRNRNVKKYSNSIGGNVKPF